MGLFKRISDIISANINEMVELNENPELLLKQAIREMEDSITTAESETAKVLVNEKRIARELAHNEAEGSKWTDRASKAVEAGDDDMARRALHRKREHDTLVVALREEHDVTKGASATLKNQLEGMRAKLAEAKRSQATLAARNRAAEVRKRVFSESLLRSDLVHDDAAFDKFERMRKKVEQAEAEADALAELRGDVATSVQTQRSDLDSDVEDDLAELKSRLRRPT